MSKKWACDIICCQLLVSYISLNICYVYKKIRLKIKSINLFLEKRTFPSMCKSQVKYKELMN